MEEYSAVFDDDDIEFVGVAGRGWSLHARAGWSQYGSHRVSATTWGMFWVVGTWSGPDGEALRGRAHLIVTVPLYMRWEPWRVMELPGAADYWGGVGQDRREVISRLLLVNRS